MGNNTCCGFNEHEKTPNKISMKEQVNTEKKIKQANLAHQISPTDPYHKTQNSKKNNQQDDPYHKLGIITDPNNGIFEFAVISDQDQASKIVYNDETDETNDNERVSYFQHGTIKFDINEHKLDNISFDLPSYAETGQIDNECVDQETKSITVKTEFVDAKKQRGAELSALNRFVMYDNYQMIFTGDDRTGILFEISKKFKLNPVGKIVEKINITNDKLECCVYNKDHLTKQPETYNEQGMKIEWMTAKKNSLIIGSNGLECVDWDTRKVTPAHTFVTQFWVKEMKFLKFLDWSQNYNTIRKAVGAVFPGWMSIETIIWSKIHQKWFILPRYISFAPFNNLMGNYGCNILLIATESFDKIERIHINLNKPDDNNIEYVESLYKDYSLIGHEEMNEYKNDFEGAKKHRIITTDDVKEDGLIERQTEISKSLFYSPNAAYGFSDAQFLPGTNDSIIVGIQSKENKKTNELSTTLCIFDIHGEVFVEDYHFKGNRKYEGLVVF